MKKKRSKYHSVHIKRHDDKVIFKLNGLSILHSPTQEVSASLKRYPSLQWQVKLSAVL